MNIVAQISFILLVALATFLFIKKIKQIRRNILLGRNEDFSDNKPQRWKNLILLAFGQKKMFKKPLVALMHLVVYVGFIIVNIELLEIVLDGILGTHRLFEPILGNYYSWLINSFELLAVFVIIVCISFLTRRNIIRLKRFISKDLNGWPRSDANYILFAEIILMSLFLIMNATDDTQSFFISSHLKPLFSNISSQNLGLIEKTSWWLHITGIFTFLNYLPYSKHLHILLAFPNAYYARLQPLGKMQNMPNIQQEVLYAMQPELAPTNNSETKNNFGAKDIFDLSWKNLLDAYSCTECGRCTEQCPANITGKLLSPRMIMMKTRDRCEEIGNNLNNKSGDYKQKTLLHDYISVEELRACTTCNACVETCPVSISPLDIISHLRRYLIMEESNAPQEWNSMFSNIENNFAPWKFSPGERDAWITEINN